MLTINVSSQEINAIDTTSASTQESKELSDAAVYDPLNFDPYTQGGFCIITDKFNFIRSNASIML